LRARTQLPLTLWSGPLMITTSTLSQRLPEKEPLPPWRMPVTP
jgi:hypothetical protein